MGGPVQSLVKYWYGLTASPARARRTWSGKYWRDEPDGTRNVACRGCPKFRPAGPSCAVPFGSPVRKCVVASVEAHLHDAAGKDVLEIGFGRFVLGRNLVRRAGGTWTGIDLSQPRLERPALGDRVYGHAAEIPFAAGTFDLVFGIQTLEHWGELAPEDPSRRASDYGACLREVWRVLKPGGGIYFDAPIHLHGHEMFVVGDVPRIRAIFDPSLWEGVTVETWRRDHDPLPPYPPEPGLYPDWGVQVHGYGPEVIEEIKRRSIWLIAVTARKRVIDVTR